MTATAQWQTALDRANVVRADNAAFKKRLAAMPYWDARRAAADAIGDPMGGVGVMTIRAVVKAIPRFGETKVTATLLSAGIYNSDRRVSDLTRRQRAALVGKLLER